MDQLLQQVLGLLRYKNCAYDSAKPILENLIDVLQKSLNGQVGPVEKVQIQALTNFPTAIDQVIALIIKAIEASQCTNQQKAELLRLLDRFINLVVQYRG